MMSETVSSRGRDEGRRRKKQASSSQQNQEERNRHANTPTGSGIFLSGKLYFASNTYTHS